MIVSLKQGINEAITFEMPFDVSLLSKFTVDLWQHGQQVIQKTNEDCIVDGDTITVPFNQADTLRLAPQRVSLNFRGLYPDGGTVIIESVPVVIERTDYRRIIT